MVPSQWCIAVQPLRTDPEDPVTVEAPDLESAVTLALLGLPAADYDPRIRVVDCLGMEYIYNYLTREITCPGGGFVPVVGKWFVRVQRGFPLPGPHSYRPFDTLEEARKYKRIVDCDPEVFHAAIFAPGERLE